MDYSTRNVDDSWKSVQATVHQFHKNVSPLMRKVPNSIMLREETGKNGSLCRVYFLAPPAGQNESTIMYVDVQRGTDDDSGKALQWKMLLDPEQVLSFTDEVSPEEQLLRERKRIRSTGITSYDFQNFGCSGTFAFSANSTVYTCSDALVNGKLALDPILAQEIVTDSTSGRYDVHLCPCNPNLVAFISESDLWISSTSTGEEHRLTSVGKESKDSVKISKSAGAASFVVQEEFDRCTGYWWQPSCEQAGSGLFTYRLLYEEVDESDVSVLNIVPPEGNGDRVDTYRYPRAGTQNARSDLKIVEFKATAAGESIQDIRILTLEKSLSHVFPRMEYLLRAGWVPNSNWFYEPYCNYNNDRVYAEVIDRKQTFLQVALLNIGSFLEEKSSSALDMDEDDSMSDLNFRNSPVIIYEETSDAWVRVHNLIHFLEDSCSADRVSFIIGSEKSGYMHLYHITTNTSTTDGSKTIGSYGPDGNYCKAEIVSNVQLTQGDWEVDGKQLWVCKKTKSVFFIGYKDTPLESHLYTVSYATPGSVSRLTELGFSHVIEMNSECSMFATVFSSLQTSTACQIYYVTIDSGAASAKYIGTVLETSESPSCIVAPEPFTYASPTTGYQMHGLIFKPNDFNPSVKYPAVVFVYGGPQFQLVSNSFKALRLLRLHIITSIGFVVVVLDGRGSDHRGLKFAAEIKNKLGSVEVDDQVEGLRWLSSQYGFIDMNRIGIHGWSYGGYLSLKYIMQHPEIFKVAVAGAPVTSWQLYDTGYTERYLGLPEQNHDAYVCSSVVDHAQKFPNEEGRLLIIQGLMDENVHFYHTSSLVDALVKACKPHELQIYPNERHGIRSAQANQHYETMLVCFLKKHLL